MNKLNLEKGSKQEKLIQSLISIKHRSQQIVNNRLSFPLPVADVLLLTPIDLHSFNSDCQDILNSIKKLAPSDKNLNRELDRFPVIIAKRYDNSIVRRVFLLIAALLFFFPFGIYIYYLSLSRRGELKSKLMEIKSCCHTLVPLIHNYKE
jgi:hypothetical protein